MLDMGFKPQVDRLVRGSATTARRCSSRRRSTARSASSRGATRTSPLGSRASCPAERRTGEVDHRFVAVTADNKVDTLVELLRAEDRGLVLVFVRTKAGADRLVEKLHRNEVDAIAIHGDKGQAQRENALERFRRRQGPHAGRHRRRGPRSRRRRHHARDQLRSAGGARRLHAPRRTHRSCGQGRRRDHAGAPGAAGRRLARGPATGTGRALRGFRHADGEASRRLHITAARGGRSKW